MQNANSFSPETLGQLESLFLQTIEFVYELLGEKAFFLYRVRNGIWKWYPRATTAVYDPLMAAAANYLGRKDKILAKKENVEEMMKEFYQANYDSFEGRNTNPGVVQERELKFDSFFTTLLS